MELDQLNATNGDSRPWRHRGRIFRNGVVGERLRQAVLLLLLGFIWFASSIPLFIFALQDPL